MPNSKKQNLSLNLTKFYLSIDCFFLLVRMILIEKQKNSGNILDMK